MSGFYGTVLINSITIVFYGFNAYVQCHTNFRLRVVFLHVETLYPFRESIHFGMQFVTHLRRLSDSIKYTNSKSASIEEANQLCPSVRMSVCCNANQFLSFKAGMMKLGKFFLVACRCKKGDITKYMYSRIQGRDSKFGMLIFVYFADQIYFKCWVPRLQQINNKISKVYL